MHGDDDARLVRRKISSHLGGDDLLVCEGISDLWRHSVLMDVCLGVDSCLVREGSPRVWMLVSWVLVS